MWSDFQNAFQQLIRKKILYIHRKHFYLTCCMLLHYLLKFENPKKYDGIFVLNVTINVFKI